METDTLVYDVEVFKYNSMVVFKDLEGETVRVFSSHLDGLGEYVDKGLIKRPGYKDLREFIDGKTLIGYNNYFYDDKILYAMSMDLGQEIIKIWNDALIERSEDVNIKRINNCKTLDVFQQIDVSRPSLKKIEGNMGRSIIESKVSFDIDRPLTPDENLETVKYCEYDVLSTLEIYKMRQSYYSSKRTIVDMIEEEHLRERAVRWNTTSIVGQILRSKKIGRPGALVDSQFKAMVPGEVRDMWAELDGGTLDYKWSKKKVITQEFGNVIEFGWGGLHGAPPSFGDWEDVRLADVASMYPSIIINFEGLGDKTQMYADLKKERIKIKHANKPLSDAYKLVLNSTYGLLNNKYSHLNDPYLAYSVCIYGQISLYVLSQRLAAIGARIININTDGVAYVYHGDLDEQVKKDWEKEFNLTLETEYYKRWIQKDVNNYIAVDDEDCIKVKGGDCGKYHANRFFSNNNTRILDIALVDYLVYGTPVYKTIMDNEDKPILYQYVLQAGGTYKGVVDTAEPEVLLDTKVNRVFATKGAGMEIAKKRQDGGIVKFPDAPGRMYLWNDDVRDLRDFDEIVDLQWYVDLVEKNLKRWR